ncbi:GNAT family N-acetyltransferase [Flavobacterium terrae]|uniref:Protein N-acetyltransferase, RimJ/RimL family n=1 Tax=Flavobacterium terrae TaxID=415425 RepID=A0A1M6GY80_9FLAO|nr:GNAT family N-acetyltransferase [Flavobacterium terrae]SHJ14919.1 Protein N-acetyltransferase, RimJ/RimL family [Flavobacterium terrae]
MSNIKIDTERVFSKPLDILDYEFIYKLLNTEGWKRFIGDRNIHSNEEAKLYIDKIEKAENIKYFVITEKKTHKKIGLFTIIKREFLNHPDIGFAFLPEFNGKGFAYETSKAFMEILSKEHSGLSAITNLDNVNSIKLLKKLGLKFKEVINENDEQLNLFEIEF